MAARAGAERDPVSRRRLCRDRPSAEGEPQEDLRNAIARAAQGEMVRYDAEVYGRKGGAETMIMDFTLLPVMDERGPHRLSAAGRAGHHREKDRTVGDRPVAFAIGERP